MAVKTIFVGVNKHQDTGIPELSGARPNATTLWALFTDTLPGLSARLLLDDKSATHAETSEAILGMFAHADHEGVVVVTIAGHGSPDGNLVSFDTDPANLSGTALSMAACQQAQIRAARHGDRGSRNVRQGGSLRQLIMVLGPSAVLRAMNQAAES